MDRRRRREGEGVEEAAGGGIEGVEANAFRQWLKEVGKKGGNALLGKETLAIG